MWDNISSLLTQMTAINNNQYREYDGADLYLFHLFLRYICEGNYYYYITKYILMPWYGYVKERITITFCDAGL